MQFRDSTAQNKKKMNNIVSFYLFFHIFIDKKLVLIHLFLQ